MRGQLPDISPSSGAFRATFPPKGEGFVLRGFPPRFFPFWVLILPLKCATLVSLLVMK